MAADRDVRDYLDALKHQRRLSPATLRNYRHALQLLLGFLQKEIPEKIEAAHIRRMVAQLHAKGLSPRTLALVLSAWRGWFRWLVRHRGLRANPVLGIRAPKAGRPLPKALSVEAAQKLLDNAPANDAAALRDRAMFELLYSSGLRVGELVALDTGDGRLDLAQGEVTVTGKGAKTRTVPVGTRAREALKAWMSARRTVRGPRKRRCSSARGASASPPRSSPPA
jgi:integrase/recombinase XerC